MTHGTSTCKLKPCAIAPISHQSGLIWGPPCVAHSRLGKQEGFKDPRVKCHDIGLQFAQDGCYDWLICENVKDYPMAAQLAKLKDFEVGTCLTNPRKIGYNYNRERLYGLGINHNTREWITHESLQTLVDKFNREPQFPTCLHYFCMSNNEIKQYYDWYDETKDIKNALCEQRYKNLEAYRNDPELSMRTVWDLQQSVVSNKGSRRPRTSLVNGDLCCLTTNSGQLYSHQLGRIMFPEEMLLVHGLPITPEAAHHAETMQWQLDKASVSYHQNVVMAGNGMHVPTVALLLTILAMCTKPKAGQQ